MKRVLARRLVRSACRLGEGLRWDGARDELLWLDVTGSRLHRLGWTHREHSVIDLTEPVSAVARHRDGRLLAVHATGVGVIDDRTGVIEGRYELLRPGAGCRLNDASVDAQGRLWVGSAAPIGGAADGHLWSIDVDGRVAIRREHIVMSNGMGWTADGTRFFHVDSGTYSLTEFEADAASGSLREPRAVVVLAADDGIPDGLSVDSANHTWLAVWGAGQVRRLDANGVVQHLVEVPAALTTTACFAGPDLRTLCIATARPDSPRDGDGDLYYCEPGIAGFATPLATIPI